MPVTNALENVNKIGDPYLQRLQEFLAKTGLTIGPSAPEHQQELNTLAAATAGQIRPTPEMAIPQPAISIEEGMASLSNPLVKEKILPYLQMYDKLGMLQKVNALREVPLSYLRQRSGSSSATGLFELPERNIFVGKTPEGFLENLSSQTISPKYQMRNLQHEFMHNALTDSDQGQIRLLLKQAKEAGITVKNADEIAKYWNPKKYSIDERAARAEELLADLAEKLSPEQTEGLLKNIASSYVEKPKKSSFVSEIQKPEAKLKERFDEASKKVELRHYTKANLTEGIPTKKDQFDLVWFTEGESYLKGKHYKLTIPDKDILRIDENPKILDKYLSSEYGKLGRSKEQEIKFAESLGYKAVKRGNDVAMRPETAKILREEVKNPQGESHLNAALSEATKIVGVSRLKGKLTEMLGDVEQVNEVFNRAGIKK